MKTKQSSNKNLNVLKAPFENWFLERYTKGLNELNYEPYPKALLKAKGLSQTEFDKKYIQPFIDLDENLLEIALKSLCVNLKEKISSPDYSYTLCKQPRIGRQLNALQWLLVQVVDLGLFELPNKLNQYYKKPYNQCLYCGKPDFYIRNKKEIAFNEKIRFCHHDNCDMTQTNFGDHDINCHYKMWKQKKKNLHQTILRNSKFYNGDKWHDINVDNKLIRTFLDFCENQFNDNLKIDYTIQFWTEWPEITESRQLMKAMHYKDLSL